MARRPALLAVLAGLGAEAKSLIKGISYGPAPLKEAGKLPNDDFMIEDARALWGLPGRNDLEIMSLLGANAVRLYGLDPSQNHTAFLDEAHSKGLEVIPGLSDYPYTQMPGNCASTGWNCFTQIKAQYTMLLQNGFLSAPDSYHPSLKRLIVINEADLKVAPIYNPKGFSKVIMSAIDAMLEVEKEMNVTQNLPVFTATFSFGICNSCLASKHGQKPSLNQMLELRHAMLNPDQYDYEPKNNLTEAYQTRVSNSFNTANPARDIKPLFLDAYELDFPKVPVFIGEFHSPNAAVMPDLQDIMNIAAASPVLQGVSFFEYQVRYDKGGSEEAFGMFGLGNVSLGMVSLAGAPFHSWCLLPQLDPLSKAWVPVEVTQAFRGKGLDWNLLCLADPAKVQLDEAGFLEIQRERNATGMAVFMSRIVGHMGGSIADKVGFQGFAKLYSDPASGTTYTFAKMLSDISGHPAWGLWDTNAACVADRTATDGMVGQALGDACGTLSQQKVFDCATGIPQACGGGGSSGSLWQKADYVFSVYYFNVGGNQNPLQNCYFNGAAAFAPNTTYQQDMSCVVTGDPATTPLTEEAYHRIISESDEEIIAVRRLLNNKVRASPAHVARVSTFIKRVVIDMGMEVDVPEGLQQVAENPPSSLAALRASILTGDWTCGGALSHQCGQPRPSPTPPSPGPGPAPGGKSSNWWIWLVVGACTAAVLGGGAAATVVYRRRRDACRQPFTHDASLPVPAAV